MTDAGTRTRRVRRTSVLVVVVLAVIVAYVVWRPTGGPDRRATPGPRPPTTAAPGRGTVPSRGSVGAVAALPGPTGAQGIALGVYVKPGGASGDLESAIAGFESSIGRRLAVIQTFTGWQTASGAPVPFPTTFADYVEGAGATPMITWQPEQAVTASQSPGGRLSDQPDFSLRQLTSGRYDSYIRSWALAAKAFDRVVYVRMMHEMNDRTYPWSIGVNGNTGADEYVAAWRHIVGIFQAAGATNVQFVWCVGAEPAVPDPAVYFPGDRYVSWIALDGYNRGTPWQSLTSIMDQAYTEITAVSPLPVMIAETGSVEQPGDPTAKSGWISSALEREIPQAFPRVRAVLYFDAPGRGFSYALSSSTQALQAFAQVAGSAGYQARLPS